jgi:AraC-like DNA-binding protein
MKPPMTLGPVPVPLRHHLGSYREYEPPPALALVAEGAWSFRTKREISHRVLPDPAVSLAFWCSRDPSGRPVSPRLALIGAKSRPHLVRFEAGCEITALRLKLEWIEPVLGLVPGEHEDTEHDLPAILPNFGMPLFDGLVETRTSTEAAGLLESAVARQLCRTRVERAKVPGRALDLVRRARGCVPIDVVAQHMGVSMRHLRRLVQQAAGVSLKAYARAQRIVGAMTAADHMNCPQWARLAADSGFYDQSHLVRECRALCGMTPVAVHRERRLEAELSNRG